MIANLFVALVAAAALNPLVVRTNEPHGNVPADCLTSDRPPVRVQIAEAEPETAAPLPPVRAVSKPVTTHDTEELRRALAQNDRPAFDAALARAREAGVPARVYEDIARLWDAQFESPFFAEGSEPHRIASGYPGYEAAVRRQVFTDAKGRKFYPAAESRAFVASQVGVKPSRTTKIATTRPAPSPKPSKPRSRPSVARRRIAAPTRQVATTKPAPVVSKPVELPPVPSTTTEAPPAPAVASDTYAPAPTPTPAAPATATETLTTAPATDTTTPVTPATPSKGRSVVLPAILILIGLGVLILLFRTAK